MTQHNRTLIACKLIISAETSPSAFYKEEMIISPDAKEEREKNLQTYKDRFSVVTYSITMLSPSEPSPTITGTTYLADQLHSSTYERGVW